MKNNKKCGNDFLEKNIAIQVFKKYKNLEYIDIEKEKYPDLILKNNFNIGCEIVQGTSQQDKYTESLRLSYIKTNDINEKENIKNKIPENYELSDDGALFRYIKNPNEIYNDVICAIENKNIKLCDGNYNMCSKVDLCVICYAPCINFVNILKEKINKIINIKFNNITIIFIDAIIFFNILDQTIERIVFSLTKIIFECLNFYKNGELLFGHINYMESDKITDLLFPYVKDNFRVSLNDYFKNENNEIFINHPDKIEEIKIWLNENAKIDNKKY